MKLQLFDPSCSAPAEYLWSYWPFIDQTESSLFSLYFDVHLTEFNLLPLLALCITHPCNLCCGVGDGDNGCVLSEGPEGAGGAGRRSLGKFSVTLCSLSTSHIKGEGEYSSVQHNCTARWGRGRGQGVPCVVTTEIFTEP